MLLLLWTAPLSAMTIHHRAAPEGVAAMSAWLEAHPEGAARTAALGARGYRCINNDCGLGVGWELTGEDMHGYISFHGDLSGTLTVARLQQALSYVSVHYRVPLEGGWSASFNSFQPYRVQGGGLWVERCQDRELVVRVTQPTVEMSADRPDDPRCQPLNAEGAMPQGCSAYIYDLQVPTELLLRVTIPEEAGRCLEGGGAVGAAAPIGSGG